MKLFASAAILAALTGADMPFETRPSTSGSPSPLDVPHTKVRILSRENAAVSGKPIDERAGGERRVRAREPEGRPSGRSDI